MKHWIVSLILFLVIVSSILFIRGNYSFHIKNIDEVILTTKKTNLQKPYKSRKEIALIYVGSSSCPFCKSQSLDSVLTYVSEELEIYSREEGYNFNKIGLSQDFNPNQGIEHLMKFEISFNEISTGNNWRNTTIEKYTNNTFQASLGTPQILIIQRA